MADPEPPNPDSPVTADHIDTFEDIFPPVAEPGSDLDSPEPGWLPRARTRYNSQGRSFASGDPDGDRLRVRYFEHKTGGGLMAKVWFGPAAEGPPGHAHGGSIATVLDEAMGGLCWFLGHSVVAAKLEVSYRNMLPLGTVARITTSLEQVDGRKVHVTGVVRGADGTIYASGRGLFVALRPERFGDLGLRPHR